MERPRSTMTFHGVKSIELRPMNQSGGTTWHEMRVNGFATITFFTDGKDLIPHVLDKEAFSTNSVSS